MEGGTMERDTFEFWAAPPGRDDENLSGNFRDELSWACAPLKAVIEIIPYGGFMEDTEYREGIAEILHSVKDRIDKISNTLGDYDIVRKAQTGEVTP